MSKRTLLMLAAAALGLLALDQATHASHVYRVRPTSCEPGYQIVECVEMQTVVRRVCKVVPDVKKIKKICYSCQDEGFCLPHLPCACGHRGCNGCGPDCGPPPACGEPQCRKLLIKREIVTECPSWKCVVEEIFEQVPCKVYRKVPCAAAPPCVAPTGIPPAGIVPEKLPVMPKPK